MADKALEGVTLATSIAASDLLYAVIGGNSRRIALDKVLTSPTLTTPILGVATATSLAIGGATIGANALAVNGQVTNVGGTITTSQPFTITQTWNNAAVTFTGALINITNTASTILLSSLLDIQLGGVSQVAVIRQGSQGFLRIGAAPSNPHMGSNGNNLQIYDGNQVCNVAINAIQYRSLSTGYFGWAASTDPAAAADTTISRNAAGTTQFGSGSAVNASGAWLAAKGTLTGGTLADQAQVLAITATQPASPTGTQNAILTTITGAGSASQTNYAQKLFYGAGYTGTSFNAALNIVNTNAGSLSSGLFVGLADTTPSVSAALIVDNGATTQPIFLARDNGSTVFTIADGGAVTATSSFSALSVNASANIISTGGNLGASSAGFISWGSRSEFTSPSDGVVLVTQSGGGGFARLQLGGTTSSFPAIKRSTTSLQARLADDSAFTAIQGKLTTDNAATTGLTAGVLAATTNATIVIYDSTGQAYRVPVII